MLCKVSDRLRIVLHGMLDADETLPCLRVGHVSCDSLPIEAGCLIRAVCLPEAERRTAAASQP